jgi:predicted MFS family arabinose efflux permease
VWSETLCEDRHAAYALMTVMLESTYIAGPLLAGILIAAWSATAAVATIAALSLTGAVAFGASGAARRRKGMPKQPGRLAALAAPGIRTVLVTAAAFGLTFGTLDVAFPAFAREHGSTAVAGVLLAALAAGGALGGFAYGLRRNPGPATRHYAALCLLAAAGLAPLIAAPSLPVMVALAVLSGACFAPVTTRQVAVVDDVVDSAHRAEAFTWLSTAYGAGLAAGAAIAGQLVQADVIRACFGLACASVLAASVFTTARGLQAGRGGGDQRGSNTLRPAKPAASRAPPTRPAQRPKPVRASRTRRS